MSRTVQPEKIKTLRDWVSRWPKATNLGFDDETREPTVYSTDAARSVVGGIPWRREGDTLTILSTPAKFTEGAVAVARRRYGTYREKVSQMREAAEEQLRIQERALMDAWQAYNAAPVAERPAMRRDILAAEKAIREVEKILAEQIYQDRHFLERKDMVGAHIPPMPVRLRGIPMAAIAAGVETAVEE